ncbi:MAG: nucleobase:cation symporter, family, partial [Actinomycetota bacterium]|nr:nucleobase:cation symporter, family [Actinomycetota bacterium]
MSIAAKHDWGIEPVPLEERRLGTFDLAILWGDLGIGLLVLVTGALLVPGLGFFPALGVIVVGSIIGVALLAAVGAVGARDGVPTMALFRPILGVTGSWVPSTLNLVQLVGWTAVELWAMSYVANLVSIEVLGIHSEWLWLAVAALLCTGLALWGPVGVTRIWMEKFGAWVIVGISLIVTFLVFTQEGLIDALTAPGQGVFPTIGPALDLVIAMPISWLPLVADYNRFARGTRAAARGTFWGYLLANVWLYTLGALLVLGAGADASPAGIAAGILAVAGGSLAGILFLIGLLAGEADEAFADIYSGAMSLKNIWPKAPEKLLIVGIAAVATVLAGWLTMDAYENFLFLLGSVFIPLFGVFIAHHYFRPVNRSAAFAAWILGFALYHWILPTGPDYWLNFVDSAFG